MTDKIQFLIKSDTGLTSRHIWPAQNKLPETQEDMLTALTEYGNWIYSIGYPMQYEYKNHWLKKLNTAKEFTLELIN